MRGAVEDFRRSLVAMICYCKYRIGFWNFTMKVHGSIIVCLLLLGLKCNICGTQVVNSSAREWSNRMNRRRFIKSLGLLAISAAVPPVLMREWRRSGIITGETFHLDRTLVLDLPSEFLIRNCRFIANEGFSGGSMVHLVNPISEGVIESCFFDGGGYLPEGSAALHFSGTVLN